MGGMRLGERMFVEHSDPGMKRCHKSSKYYCYGILTQQGREISKAFFSQLARSYLEELLVGGDGSQGLVMTEERRHQPRCAELLWAPSASTGASVPPQCFLVHTHTPPVRGEKPEMKTESSDTWLMEALRQGLSLLTGTLGNNWYKLPQTLKAAGPPSHRLFLGPIRQIKWHQNYFFYSNV